MDPEIGGQAECELRLAANLSAAKGRSALRRLQSEDGSSYGDHSADSQGAYFKSIKTGEAKSKPRPTILPQDEEQAQSSQGYPKAPHQLDLPGKSKHFFPLPKLTAQLEEEPWRRNSANVLWRSTKLL